MTAREAEMLLGGYAAGILTEEERSSLFGAALDNQALFDALADDEALRALMADPRARAELLRAVTAESDDPAFVPEEQVAFLRAPTMMPEPAPARETWWRKLFRPAPMAAFGAVAVAAVGLVVVLRPGKLPEAQSAKASEVKGVEAAAARNDAPLSAPESPRKAEAVARVVKSSELESKDKLEAKLRGAESDRNQVALRDEEKPKLAKQAEPAGPPPHVSAPPPAATVHVIAPSPQLQSQSQSLSQSQSQSQSRSQVVAVEERKADLARASPPPAEPPAAAPAPARQRAVGFGGALSGIRRLEVTPPIDFWIELDRTRTTQKEFKVGDAVRVVVEARTSGRLQATIDQQEVISTEARPRQRYTIPSRGSLRDEAGDRNVELTFQPAAGDPIRITVRVTFR